MKRGRYQPRPVPLAVKADVFDLFFAAPESENDFALEANGAVAVVEITGPLCQRPGWFWDSYEEIETRVKAAFASSAKSVVLRVDSPGGDALGCFECSRALRTAALEANKPLYAFADGMAASAAYGLSCGASKIFVPPAGFVGSIGVLQPIIDATAADAAWGMKFTLLASGARKADGNPHQSLTQEAQAELQARVDSLADLFFDLVAEARPVSAAHVRGLEGRMFHGAAAVKAGLADAVKTWAEVLAIAAGTSTAKAESSAGGTSMDTEKKAAAMKAIRDAYGDDKEGAEKAIKSAFPDEGEDKEKKEKDEKAKAEAEEKEKCKAKEEKEKEEAKALAANAQAGDFAALKALALKNAEDNAKLRAELAAKEEAAARASLLAKRPDFTQDQKDLLALVSLAEVEKAVEKWPRSGPVKLRSVPTPAPTPGASQSNDPNAATLGDLDADAAEHIRKKMGVRGRGSVQASSYVDGTHELNFVSPEAAARRLEELKKEASAK